MAAAGWPELGQKLLTSCCSLAADGFINPNYEDYCPAQICVSGAVVRLPKCPFSLPANYSRVRWGTALEYYRDTGPGKPSQAS